VNACRHCRQGRAVRRGLCRRCYYDRPGVRELYASGNAAAAREAQAEAGRNERPAAARPTRALPGSEAKLRVLVERARLGVQLWHPNDARVPE
jgi:hypothetical protein